jgi:hypothetical protein
MALTKEYASQWDAVVAFMAENRKAITNLQFGSYVSDPINGRKASDEGWSDMLSDMEEYYISDGSEFFIGGAVIDCDSGFRPDMGMNGSRIPVGEAKSDEETIWACINVFSGWAIAGREGVKRMNEIDTCTTGVRFNVTGGKAIGEFLKTIGSIGLFVVTENARGPKDGMKEYTYASRTALAEGYERIVISHKFFSEYFVLKVAEITERFDCPHAADVRASSIVIATDLGKDDFGQISSNIAKALPKDEADRIIIESMI